VGEIIPEWWATSSGISMNRLPARIAIPAALKLQSSSGGSHDVEQRMIDPSVAKPTGRHAQMKRQMTAKYSFRLEGI